jgi:hypothetical protein
VGDEPPRLSRRGLIGLFGRGVRGFRDGLSEDGARPADGLGGEEGPPPDGYPVTDRLLRPFEENVEALTVEPGRARVDLEGRELPPGGSIRVYGMDLPEALVLVRVDERHAAACSSECPVDGSDILWEGAQDLLECPACGSLWRLDGKVMDGVAAEYDLQRYVVEEQDDGTLLVHTG